MYQLVIFYDGKCPLCVNEMQHLSRIDKDRSLSFFDIHNPKLLIEHSDINFSDANDILHGKTANGEVLKGLDVTYEAWRLVGKGYLIAPLRWFWLRPIADKVYLLFAKNRFTVSRWLTGKPRCTESCELPFGPKKKMNDE